LARSFGAELSIPTQNALQIIELHDGQAPVAFRVAGEDEKLEALGGLFQDGEHSGQAAGVGGGEDVVQDEEPAVVSCQDLFKVTFVSIKASS
jgi:hypothetical protein